MRRSFYIPRISAFSRRGPFYSHLQSYTPIRTRRIFLQMDAHLSTQSPHFYCGILGTAYELAVLLTRRTLRPLDLARWYNTGTPAQLVRIIQWRAVWSSMELR